MTIETSTISLSLWTDTLGMIVWLEFLTGFMLLWILHPAPQLFPSWLLKLQGVYAGLLALLLLDVNAASPVPLATPYLTTSALLVGSFLTVIIVLDAVFRALPVLPALGMRLVSYLPLRKSKPTA